jgi:hypothetical protein
MSHVKPHSNATSRHIRLKEETQCFFALFASLASANYKHTAVAYAYDNQSGPQDRLAWAYATAVCVPEQRTMQRTMQRTKRRSIGSIAKALKNCAFTNQTGL